MAETPEDLRKEARKIRHNSCMGSVYVWHDEQLARLKEQLADALEARDKEQADHRHLMRLASAHRDELEQKIRQAEVERDVLRVEVEQLKSQQDDALRICSLAPVKALIQERDTLRTTLAAVRGLLVRLLGWDDLPTRADGPYWIGEIRQALALLDGTAPEEGK